MITNVCIVPSAHSQRAFPGQHQTVTALLDVAAHEHEKNAQSQWNNPEREKGKSQNIRKMPRASGTSLKEKKAKVKTSEKCPEPVKQPRKRKRQKSKHQKNAQSK